MSHVWAYKCRAMGLVRLAILSGEIVRPDTCSLCGDQPSDVVYSVLGRQIVRPQIVAHHWKGYEDEVATDVLWICQKCNCALRGPEYHNGSLGIDELKQIISERKARQEQSQMLNRAKLTLTILYILYIALFAPIPHKVRVVTPDLIIRPVSLEEALDMSLAAGDGRRVNWQAVV